jgi:hypothetical protein
VTTTHRTFVSYIDRTREFYAAQGYERPYQWAQNESAPFAELSKPLADCRAALITTASVFREKTVDPGSLRGTKQVWSGETEPPPERLFTDDLSWDKQATHTDDVESFLPITALRGCAESGRIGSMATHFFGVPTDYSQRRTIADDAPEILRRCREDGVDVALLVPL